MKHSEFEIGKEFMLSDRVYRCTDKGTRVVSGIRVDQVTIAGSGGDTRELDRDMIRNPRVLDREQAEAEGWFNGPPYAVYERLFDEDDQQGCEPCPS